MARGSVKPRPLGDGTMRYRIKWETVGPDGKRRYHSATRRTKAEADAFLVERLGEVNDGTFVVPSKETVGAYLERWLEASRPTWAESTYYNYRGVVRCRIKPHLGHVVLARLDELAIQGCYSKLVAAGYAPKSVRLAHNVLDGALERAVKWRVLSRNPADGAKPPAALDGVPAAWDATEANAFLEGTKDDKFAALWRLGLDAGMRVGEMLAMQWADADLERGVVSVRRTMTKKADGSMAIGDLAKTAASRRAIDVGPSTVAALRGLRAPQAARRLACGGSWVDLGLVFDAGDGRALHPSTVSGAFAGAVKRHNGPEALVKVRKLTPHGMRHTMATLMLEAGVHPKVVQERLGHKTIQLTLDRYSHVTKSMQRQAADLMEEILGGGARPGRGQDVG